MAADDIAQRIVRDIRTAAPFDSHSSQPPRSLGAAYALQDQVAAILERDAAFGSVAGWKIAANSAALMDRFGPDAPASGRVFAAQRYDGPAVLCAGDYRQFALEPEIAAIIGATLSPRNAPFDAARIQEAIDRFVPAMELLDMRDVEMSKVHLPDAVAQNITNAGAVLGGPGVAPASLDPAAVRTVLTIDGAIRHDTIGAAPQDPLAAVTWLANHLARRDMTLEAGQIVLCGSHTPICHHDGPGEIVLEMSGLGSAGLRLT